MASTAQQLEVGINADATGLIRATSQASTALSGLQTDLQKLDAAGDIEFTPEMHLQQIDRNIALVKKSLQTLDAQRADPDVVMDSSQFLAQQRKLFNELRRLQGERVDVEASLHVDQSGVSRFQSVLNDLTAGGGPGSIPGLARALESLGASGAGAVGGVGAAAAAVYGLGQQAADVETQVIRLDALTEGMGAELFSDLQKFAQQTPFALDEVTAATQRLLAAGVDLQDIPGYLQDIGEVASVTPATLEQVATIFSQMEGKGKATFEELQQLAEAGVPVWQTLADSMGLTVAQVQQLATDGKLTADTITDLRNELGDTFGGTMAKQAESFNGLMSSLKDSFAQTGQTIGSIFLPEMRDAAGALNEVAGWLNEVAGGLVEVDEKARQTTGAGLFTTITRGLGLAGPSFDEFRSNMQGAAGEAESFTHIVSGAFDGIDEAVNKGLQAAQQEFQFTVDVQTHINFLLDRADMLEQLHGLLHGKDAVELPADLHIRDIPGLNEKQEQIVRTLSSFVAAGIEQGVDKGRLFAQARKLVIDAGVDPSEANRVLRQFLGLKVEKTVPVNANTDPAAAKVQGFVQRRTGKTIYVTADTSSAAAAISRLTVDRFVNIIPRVIGGGGGETTTGIGPGGQGGARTTGRADATAGGEHRDLAPKQTPVAVYLDGTEIADKLTLQANRLATIGSARRRP